MTSEFGDRRQPRYSQDAIAEFPVSSRTVSSDARPIDGRAGHVVTKSGSNRLSGLFRGNFRDSMFNSPNRAIGQVEPINNQQYSTAVGGPVLRDKLHYFANYEYEREPRTSIWRTPYPFFNVGLEGTNNRKIGGGPPVLSTLVPNARDGQGRSGPAVGVRSAGPPKHPRPRYKTKEYNERSRQ